MLSTPKELRTDLRLGDCLTLLEVIANNIIDSMVTDPPAGIGFMGKEWDHHKGGRDQWITWMTSIMRECHRVLKPGAHGLVWALPKTSHWTATALEDAGFEIRDVVTHLFGTGFPKSLNISNAIDKGLGIESPIVGKNPAYRKKQMEHDAQWETAMRPEFKYGPGSKDAKQWQGWGTALKPASEHWILIRKPLSEKTVAANVLKYGTGGINIDASRIGTHTYTQDEWTRKGLARQTGNTYGKHKSSATEVPLGRFPANLILDEEAAHMLDEQSGLNCGAQVPVRKKQTPESTNKSNFKPHSVVGDNGTSFHNDSGGASRFFYVAKASKSDRGEGNIHPTVKSTKLMEYLIKLITPLSGTVLDPFMGSGSTGVAAINLGFSFVGIEKEEEYFKIAQERILLCTESRTSRCSDVR